MAERVRRRRLKALAQWFSQGGAADGRGEFAALREHFFGRYFDNDTLQMEGDMVAAAAQAMMLAGLPGLAAAFLVVAFMLGPLPMAAGNFDVYFFVLYSFAGMGMLAVFEWEMLFADRSDFLILTPLPLRRGDLLRAKVQALGRFAGMFLLSANACSAVFVPGAAGHNYLLTILAHAVVVTMAGCFALLLMLAVHSAMLCVLGARTIRRVLPVVQAVMAAMMIWMMLEFSLFGFAVALPGKAPPPALQWLPPFWFVSMYDKLLLGGAAPAHIDVMAVRGIWALVITAAMVALTYPLAWRRKQAMVLEAAAAGGGDRPGLFARLLMAVGAWRPEERGVFAFIGQTLWRNGGYQTCLTAYAGAGLALAGVCVISLTPGRTISIAVSDSGLYELMPLLLFWLVVGLRAAFAVPVEMGAGWVFAACGVELGRCAATARRWVVLHAMVLAVCVLALLWALHWDARRLLVQAVVGGSLALVLSDALLVFPRGIPFTRPRLPGRSNVAIAVALYVGVLPQFVLHMVDLERWLEPRPAELWIPLAAAALLRAVLREVQRREGLVYELRDVELEGTLTLGLHT